MGQYQQWLHYRSVDQQLRAQQEQIEKELAQLQERAYLPKDSATATDNVIIQALARQHRETLRANSLANTLPAQSTESVISGRDEGSVDQQRSSRTNRPVQHWMERWRRLPGSVQDPREDSQQIFAQLRPQEVEKFYQSYHYWQIQQRVARMQAQTIRPQDVEGFYQSYHYWPLQQRIAQVQAQITVIQQQISENAKEMEQARPGMVAATDNVIIQALARQHRETLRANSLANTLPAQSTESVISGRDEGSVDQQRSSRTNRPVQHWMERWRRLPGSVQDPREDSQQIFAQLRPQEVEKFYQSYHYWQIQQRIAQVQAQITVIQQQISENAKEMERVHPGAVTLAILARLQSCGVHDIDLLDRMLERGEAWLDRTLQLLEPCERLNVIGGDYMHCCELALEGDYDWIMSMLEANSSLQVGPPPTELLDEITEKRPRQKLVSDDEFDKITEKRPRQKLVSDDEIEILSIAADSAPVLPDISVVETTKLEEVEILSIEESALAEEIEKPSSVNRNIFRALLTLSSAAMLMRVVGFLNQIIVSGRFGAGAAMDAYFVASSLPTLLAQLLGSAIEASVIPVYAGVRTRGTKEQRSLLFSTLLNLILLGAALLTVLMFVFRDQMILISAPGLDTNRRELAIGLAPFIFPVLLLMVAIGFFECILNTEGQFGWPAYAGMLVPFTTAILVLTMGQSQGVVLLGVGMVVGQCLQLCVDGLRARRAKLVYRPIIDRRNPAIPLVLIAAWPELFNALISQASPIVDQIFSSSLSVGSISALNYSLKLISVPTGVIFASVGRAMLPYLSRQASAKDLTAFKETLRLYLWAVGIATTLLAIFMIALAHPLVQILFQRGAFSADDTNRTASTLIGFLFGLTPMSLGFITAKAFTALGKNRLLLYVTLFSVIANAVFDYIFALFWQNVGIALSTSAVYFCTMFIMFFMLHRMIGKLNLFTPPIELLQVIGKLGLRSSSGQEMR